MGGCCEGTKSAKGRQSKKEHCESAHVRKMTLVNKQHSSRQTKSRKSKESKSMTAETYTTPKQQLGNVRNSPRRPTQHNLQPNTPADTTGGGKHNLHTLNTLQTTPPNQRQDEQACRRSPKIIGWAFWIVHGNVIVKDVEQKWIEQHHQ